MNFNFLEQFSYVNDTTDRKREHHYLILSILISLGAKF